MNDGWSVKSSNKRAKPTLSPSGSISPTAKIVSHTPLWNRTGPSSGNHSPTITTTTPLVLNKRNTNLFNNSITPRIQKGVSPTSVKITTLGANVTTPMISNAKHISTKRSPLTGNLLGINSQATSNPFASLMPDDSGEMDIPK